MRSSAVVALALLAAAGPAFAAPISSSQSVPYTPPTAGASSSTTTSVDQSGAIKLGTIASIGSFVAPLIGGIINHFTNNGQQQQARELEELLRRAQVQDESGAIKLGTVASIGSFVAPLIGGIISHFTNNGQQQQARELEELLRRAEAEDESGAISFKTIASIGSFVAPVIGGIISHFTGGDSQQQQRDFVEMLARQDGSEAFSFSDLKNIGSIAVHVGEAVKDIFDGTQSNQQQQRDFVEMLVRSVDESGALTLEQGANIASIGSSAVGVIEPIVKDIWDHFHKSSRSVDESGALTLEQGANIASIGSSAVGVIEPIVKDIWDHFHKSSRSVDESGALTLEQGANIASIGSSAVGVIEPIVKDIWDHFHKSSRSVDESGALTLEDGANLASIASSVVGVAEPLVKSVWDHFHNSRELEELLRRAEADEQSGAIKLGTVASIGSFVAPLIGGLISHFTGGDNQQQQRDFEAALAARAFTSEETSAILNIGSNIASAVTPIINDVVNHFTHKGSRDLPPHLYELLAAGHRPASVHPAAARSINDLD